VGRLITLRIIAGPALLWLAGCGEGGASRRPASAPPAAPAEVPAPSTPTIVFLGTSLTAGLGLDPDSAYPALLQRQLDQAGLHYRVVNAGVSGESSAGALARVDWILRANPKVLVLETGANDGLRGQDPDSIEANIQAIIDRVRERSPSTRIILAGMEAMPNLGARYVKRFRAIYPAVAARNHLLLIPFLLAGVAGIDSLNQQDGIHPNNTGERLVAQNVWAVLKGVLR